MKRKSLIQLVCGVVLLLGQASRADPGDRSTSRIRFDNDRINEVFQEAMNRSPSFSDLVATLETLDRLVYIEEGRCGDSEFRGCLHVLRAPNSRILLIRIDPRQQLRSVIRQMAHELYHALEVAREPDVVHAVTLRDLYQRIGERTCFDAAESCWETRAAVAFEALVARELVKGAPRQAFTQKVSAASFVHF
jgi:hypothetical protein